MKNIRDALFPLTLLAFEAVGVRYWNIIFSDRTRWLFLGILFVAVLIRGDIRGFFFGKASVLLCAYLLWCVCTVAWSEAPELSFLKVRCIDYDCCGVCQRRARRGSIEIRRWDFCCRSWSSLCLRAYSIEVQVMQSGNIEIYEGLTGNANYLGAIAAMSIPYGLWQVYKSRGKANSTLSCP